MPIRLLITDSFPLTAYALTRSLAPHCEFVVVASQAPEKIVRCRFVDAGVPASLPRAIGREAIESGDQTELEAHFVDRLLGACIDHRITHLVPTSDSEMIAVAKRRDAFIEIGVTAVVASYKAIMAAMDKYESLRLAKTAGFPAPAAYVPADVDDAVDFARSIGYPVVVKARFSAGGGGVSLVSDDAGLARAVRRLAAVAGLPALVEYVPGSRERSITMIMSSSGAPLFTVSLRKLRYVNASLSTFIETIPELPETPVAVRLAQRLGLVGVVVLQTKLDGRDGVNKLVEINPRWGANSRMLLPLAAKHRVDPALLAIEAHDGVEEPPATIPIGATAAAPVDDLLAAVSFLHARNRPRQTADNPLPTPAAFARSYWQAYRRRPAFDAVFGGLAGDTRAATRTLIRAYRDARPFDVALIPWGEVAGG